MKRTTPSKRSLLLAALALGLLCLVSALVAREIFKRDRALKLRPRRVSTSPLPFDQRRLPRTIRVLRTKMPYLSSLCVDSYAGRCIQALPIERYLLGVVSAEEGIFLQEAKKFAPTGPSRVAAAWRVQAIAARTYAIYCVLSDKYDVARSRFQITDTPRDQAYQDRHYWQIERAIASTAGQLLVDHRGRLIYAEYSASCHGRGTRSVVQPRRRIPCHRQCQRYGFRGSSHHRGLCQWGSFLFAMHGRTLPWLLQHYYPLSRVTHPDAPPAKTPLRASVTL